MKEYLIIIGTLIWVLGGGVLAAFILIGLPSITIAPILESILNWIGNYVPEIIIVILISLLLIWGFNEKVNNPLHW